MKYLFTITWPAIVWGLIILSGPAHSTGRLVKDDWTVTGSESIADQTIHLNGCLTVQANACLTLKNVTMISGQAGICLEKGGTLIIDQSTLTKRDETGYFLFTVNGEGFELTDSTLQGCDGLLVHSDAENVLITGNTITKNRTGIEIYASACEISKNTITDNNGHGLYLNGASNCRVLNNYIRQGKSWFPLYMINSDGNQIMGNDIIQDDIPGGLTLANCDNNRIETNQMVGKGTGLNMWNRCDGNLINNNTISVTEPGIVVSGWNNRVQGNIVDSSIEQTLTGIYMVYAYNTMVSDNRLTGIGDGHGIFMRQSSHNTVARNEVTGLNRMRPSHALLMWSQCRNNVIQENTLKNFIRGLTLFYGCDANVITANITDSIDDETLVIDQSDDNYLFSDNDFSGGGEPMVDTGRNTWDYCGPMPEIPSIQPRIYTGITDRRISGSDIIENTDILLGHLVIEPGASLTLKNSNITTGAERESITDIDLPHFELGITIHDGGSLFIDGCTFDHDEYAGGFQISSLGNNIIEIKNSTINGCGNEWWYGGIQFRDSRDITVKGNRISDSMISLFNCTGGTIIGNTISNSLMTLNLEKADTLTIRGNIIQGSIDGAIRGVGSNMIIDDNVISGSWRDVINIWEGEHITISGNRISDGRKGIRGISTAIESALISSNTVNKCDTGISNGPGHQIIDNTLLNCSIGIEAGWENGRVAGNLMDHCGLGLVLSGQNHTIIKNTFSCCDTGLKTQHCSDNLIYWNNFINNTIQASQKDANNHWDNGLLGNFWNDHTASDADMDGIRDRPYFFDDGGKDTLPLVHAFPWVTTNISANQSDGALDIFSNEDIAISVGISTDGLSGLAADWWLVQTCPDGSIKSYDLTNETFADGLFTTHQGPLVSLDTTEVIEISGLDCGGYTFYFAVDTHMDGMVNLDLLSYDAVNVHVSPF